MTLFLPAVVALLVVTTLTYMLERYSDFNQAPAHAENRQLTGGLGTWQSVLWYTYGALLCQGRQTNTMIP